MLQMPVELAKTADEHEIEEVKSGNATTRRLRTESEKPSVILTGPVETGVVYKTTNWVLKLGEFAGH
jgi:hypothetical protein